MNCAVPCCPPCSMAVADKSQSGTPDPGSASSVDNAQCASDGQVSVSATGLALGNVIAGNTVTHSVTLISPGPANVTASLGGTGPLCRRVVAPGTSTVFGYTLNGSQGFLVAKGGTNS